MANTGSPDIGSMNASQLSQYIASLMAQLDEKDGLTDNAEDSEELQEIREEVTAPNIPLINQLMEDTSDKIAVRPDSNTWKFWDGILNVFGKLLDSIAYTNQCHYIKFATGFGLDCWGKEYNMARNGDDDNDYRVRIMLKIISTHSTGTVEDILNVIRSSLIGDVSKTVVENDPNESDCIDIKNIPAESLTSYKMFQELNDRLRDSVAAGIKINYIAFVESQDIQVKYGLLSQTIYNNTIDIKIDSLPDLRKLKQDK